MLQQYEKHPYTPILGWSISRYETFDKCKRMYYYAYYGKYASLVPAYKIKMLRELTSLPLETGNVVHDVLESFLKRLQKSDSAIDENRFFEYADVKMREYFSKKTFIETYYGKALSVDIESAAKRIKTCLENFISAPIYSWLFMKAIRSKDNWMIEPEGYGETRLNGLKAYCKMDFLFPVDDHVYILDWKTGRKDEHKHKQQLMGYAAAAISNFRIPAEVIFPKIIYLYPLFDEMEFTFSNDDFAELFNTVKTQTAQMQEYCVNAAENIPKPIEEFQPSPAPSLCSRCNYQELCFPDIHKKKTEEFDQG